MSASAAGGRTRRALRARPAPRPSSACPAPSSAHPPTSALRFSLPASYTVRQVARLVEKVAARPVPLEMGPPRPGDPPTLYSDPAKVKAELGWSPRFPELEDAVRHAWAWRLANYPNGPASPIDPLAYAGAAYTAETDAAPPVKDDPRIVIVGAGPTGLCAAYRLKELGYTNWQLVDKSAAAGGLATSVTDAKGFTWDIGVHVLFSHFAFFDALLDEYLQASPAAGPPRAALR